METMTMTTRIGAALEEEITTMTIVVAEVTMTRVPTILTCTFVGLHSTDMGQTYTENDPGSANTNQASPLNEQQRITLSGLPTTTAGTSRYHRRGAGKCYLERKHAADSSRRQSTLRGTCVTTPSSRRARSHRL
mmetsp:Transcript_71135/g.148359  ORF Transcript_71135/g.148359 Transcript_71135/m.148359 type:complete len:134 (-) Transcript_71135:431-832(-)